MKIHIAARLLLLFFGLVAFHTPSAAGERAFYKLAWSDRNIGVATVEARIFTNSGKLEMFDGLDVFFDGPRGMASVVSKLRIASSDGVPLNYQPMGQSGWQAEGVESDWITLQYELDLSGGKSPFPSGNEQFAWMEEGALFATGRALFVTSDADMPVEIEIATPQDWEILTSWRRSADGKFVADGYRTLTRNIIALGPQLAVSRLNASGLQLGIALLGPHAARERVVHDAFLPVLNYFTTVFGKEQSGHFAIAVLPGPNDGEAYTNSFASSQPDLPIGEGRSVWVNSLAHELFHYWAGGRITSDREHYAERQWFTEGLAEYYANRALLATGIIDQQTYDAQLSRNLSFHLFFARNRLFQDVSIKDAGRAKGTYRPGVYDSGVAAIFCLDGMIRNASKGVRGIDDLARFLDDTYGASKTPIRFESIVSSANIIIGEDRTDFFYRHIAGKEELPVTQCARSMGYDALVDGYHVRLTRLKQNGEGR